MRILVDELPATEQDCWFIKELGRICGLSNDNCPLAYGGQCEILKAIDTPQKPRRFVKPTIEEVRRYCTERRNTVDAQSFVDFYESKGWLVGKTPMKDWKAAVRTWERTRTTAAPKQTRPSEPRFFDD